jgi:hypothetical protein
MARVQAATARSKSNWQIPHAFPRVTSRQRKPICCGAVSTPLVPGQDHREAVAITTSSPVPTVPSSRLQDETSSDLLLGSHNYDPGSIFIRQDGATTSASAIALIARLSARKEALSRAIPAHIPRTPVLKGPEIFTFTGGLPLPSRTPIKYEGFVGL